MTRRASSHVRPRPPSRGRTSPQPVKVGAPDRRRVRQYKGLDARRKRAPLATRTLLGLSVAVLAIAAVLTVGNGIGPLLGSLASGFASAIGRLTATNAPTVSQLPPTDSPTIESPEQPYTNSATITMSVSVPAEAVGDETAKVRIYLALEGLTPAPVVDVPVGTTRRMTVPFELTPGRNDISATLFRAGEESEQSPVVTWFLDIEPPVITVTSPKEGEATDAFDVTIKGTTQANTTLILLNAANGTSVASVAGKDGKFETGLGLAPGSNAITITGTDPAGNVGTTLLTIIQGSKDMGVHLSASKYLISIAKHPASLQLVVQVTDPLGAPLAGATAFFTLQIPGLAPISNELVTGADGRAAFTTPLIGPLTEGGGLGTVLVTSELYGTSTDRVTLNFTK